MEFTFFKEKARGLFGFSPKGWGTPLLYSLRDWVDRNLKYPYFDKVENPDWRYDIELYEKNIANRPRVL